MANLATITTNILADSGIDDINVVVTTGSYTNPAWIVSLPWTKITGTPTTLAGYGITDAYTQTQVNNLLVGYVPYTGATSGVDIGTYTLSASNLIANGGFNAGALLLKQSSNAQTIFLGYTAITPVGNNTLNFGFSTGSGVWKNFTLSSFLLTDNINRTYTLPDASGTIALVGGSGVGTVTSVAALTIGTSGTDLSSSVANSTTTPVITLNVPTASAANRGALSAADWTTFNNKQNALTNPVTGTGTTNFLPKFTGASTIGNSLVYDNGTTVFVNTTTAPGLGNPQFYVKMATVNTYEGILVGSSTNNNVIAIAHTGTQGIITTNWGSSGATTPLAFGTNGVAQMTLSTSGNLGLGVTPSAWASPTYRAFQIGSTAALFSASGQVLLDSNSFVSTDFLDIYTTTGVATRYQQVSGQHRWFNAPSGTAGNAISFTQAMTLGTNSGLSIGTPVTAPAQGLLVVGNVGIGISPDVKLDVQGSSDTTDLIRIRKASTGSRRGALGTQSGVGYLDLYNDSSALSIRLLADGSSYFNGGNVGIGISSPAYKLHVVTDAVAGRQNMSNISRTTGNWVRFTNPQYSTDASMGLILRVFPDSDARQGAGIIASGGSNNACTNLDLFVTTSPDGLGGTSYSALNINGFSGAATFSSSVTAGKITSIAGGVDGGEIKLTNSGGGNSWYWAARTTGLNLGQLGVADERIFIANSGNVGIGTSPSFKLDVNGKIYSSTEVQGGIAVMNSAGGYATFGSNSGAVGVRVGRDAALNDIIINPSGNISIGTTTDAGAKLYVAGGIRATESILSGGLLEFTGGWSASPYNSSAWVRPASGVGVFLVNNAITRWAGFTPTSDFDINGGAFFVESDNNNVGIGTTTPNRTLQVVGSTRHERVYGYRDNFLPIPNSVSFGTVWVHLGTCNPFTTDKIYYRVATNTSEEEGEVTISNTCALPFVQWQRNTYNPMVVQVRARMTGGCGQCQVWMQIRYGTDFGGTNTNFSWQAYNGTDSGFGIVNAIGTPGTGTNERSIVGSEGYFYANSGSITVADNIGIGLTAPSAKLHIDSALGNDAIRISDTTGSVRMSIGQESSYTGNYINTRNIDMKLQTYLAGGSGGNIIFQTQNSGSTTVVDRMRITPAGNTELYGNLSLRAAATGSTATHVPVFIADPASTTRSLLTRTLQDFKFDVGSFIAKGVRSNAGDFTRTLDSTNDYSLWQDNFSWLSSYYNTKIIIEAQTTGRIQSTQSFDKVLSIGWGISSDNDFNSESYCTCNVPLGPGVVDYNVIINGTITITSTSELKMVLHVQIANGNVIVQNIIRMVNLSASAAMLNAAKNIAFTGKMDVTGTHTWSQRQTYLRLN